MKNSGRGEWWEVRRHPEGYMVVVLTNLRQSVGPQQLEDYVVARAVKGCPDCISAILECPEDLLLNMALLGKRHD